MRKNKGKSLIRSLIFGFIGLLLVIALFGSCMAGNLDESQEETNRVDEAVDKEREDVAEAEKDREEEQARIAEQEAKDKKAKEEAEAAAKVEAEELESAQAELEQVSLSLIQDSFTGVATVEFDKENKSYLITSTDPAFMQAVVMISAGQMPMDDWYMILDSMTYLSSSIQELLGNGYSVVMVNPSNTERVLVVVQDGIVTYDAMEEAI